MAITLPSRSRERMGRNEGMPGAVVREEMVFTKLPALVAPPMSWELGSANPPPPCGEELEVGV
jgi:hypothetical protein